MKIGVFGYGSIGKRHAENAHTLGHRVAVYDPANPKISPYLMPVFQRETMFEMMDAIVVASPSKEHAHDLMDAIHAGNHVLVEKPFGYDCPPLLDGFMRASRQNSDGLIAATGFNLRFHACVKKAKEMIPELGNIICASFTVNQKTEKPPYLRDGIIRNWLSHEFDLAHHLLGEGTVEMCNAPLDEHGNDSIEANVVMKFPSVQTNVFFTADYYTEPEQRYFWIEGESASLYVNLVQRTVMLKRRGQNPELILSATDSYDENYIEEMATFIKSIECGQHLAPLATAEDGVRALYTVMAAREKAGI